MNLFIAPHHDDVLLSLAARLLAGHAAGAVRDRVIVVFSEENDELARVSARMHARIGVESTSLGLEEAIRRGVPLRAALFSIQAWSPGFAHELIAPVATALRPQLAADTVVHCPLGLMHVDHAITRAAVEQLCLPKVVYYADQPYASIHENALAHAVEGMTANLSGHWNTAETVRDFLAPLSPYLSRRQMRVLVDHHRAAAPGCPEPLWHRPKENTVS